MNENSVGIVCSVEERKKNVIKIPKVLPSAIQRLHTVLYSAEECWYCVVALKFKGKKM